ncbi:Tyrosine-protein kinase wzc [subsurface metagenome]
MTDQNTTNQLDFKRILFELWDYRLFFFISLFIALASAYLFTRYSSETYRVNSVILINTETNSRNVNPNDILNVYDILNQDINLQNELSVLQSSPLIKEVLADLGLSISYFEQVDKIPKQFSFSLINIYNETPFLVVYTKEHVQPINTLFYVNIHNAEEFSLSAEIEETLLFKFDNEEYQGRIQDFSLSGNYRFGEIIENDHVSFKLLLNSNFTAEKFLNKDLYFRFNDVSQLINAYKSSLSIESSLLESTIADITFIGDNIQKSLDFVNRLIAKYIEKDLEKKNFLALNTIQYIDNQLSSVADTLNQTEQQLQNFRRNYNIMDVDETSQRLYLQLAQFELDKDDVSRRLNLLQQMKAYFDANKDASSIIIPSSMGINDPLLDNMIQELITFNSEKEQIIQNNQLRNPRLQTLNISIERLKQSISENIGFSISTTTNELQVVNNQIAEIDYEFSRLPQTQRRLLGIERQFNLTQDVYTSLMEKRIQAQIARASTLPDCEIIEPARYLGIASPRKKFSYGMAFFLGLLIPTSYVLARKFLKDTIEDKEDIKKYASIKQIGELPEHKKSSENVIINEPTEVLAESFRSIQSNIDFYLMGEKHKIILITSSLPLEGKSFSALNLATSFAQANNKTLLLKFDLRKSEENDHNFRHQELVGVSNYLIKQAALEDIIIKTDISNLDFIATGENPPNPVELLTSERTKDLMLQIKQQYDYVLVDTPPFGLVTDAFILMKYVDLSIYIARLGKITSKALNYNLEEIASKDLPNVFLLINSIKSSGFGYAKYANYPYGKKKTKTNKRIITKSNKK